MRHRWLNARSSHCKKRVWEFSRHLQVILAHSKSTTSSGNPKAGKVSIEHFNTWQLPCRWLRHSSSVLHHLVHLLTVHSLLGCLGILCVSIEPHGFHPFIQNRAGSFEINSLISSSLSTFLEISCVSTSSRPLVQCGVISESIAWVSAFAAH
jgi:hypothetical protein